VNDNEAQGKNWYNGLPDNWWHGKSKEQFLKDLKDHLDNPAWWNPKK
jgi:hypothetical protein